MEVRSVPIQGDSGGVQGVAGEEKAFGERGRPAGADEFQVAIGRGAVDFVADDRMSPMGEMDPDLVGAAGEGLRGDKGKGISVAQGPGQDAKAGVSGGTPGMHGTLEMDRGFGHLAEPEDGGIDVKSFFLRPAADDGEIGFPDFSFLHGHGGCAGGSGRFGHQHGSAGLAVEPVDERHLAAVDEFVAKEFAQSVPEGARAAGLGGMHEEAGRFVHDKEVGSFPEDFEVFLNRSHIATMVVPTMIHLRNVTRTYSSGTGIIRALDEVSLDIPAGEFVTITGPSGCGKSTLLNLLGGLDRPTSGEVMVDGVPLHGADEKTLTAYRRHTLGIVFQFFNLLPAMTVRENVELPLLLRGDSPAKTAPRVAEMLDLVGLGARAGHFPHQLSGGEMQRTAIARALAGSPRLLLADEPTGNLDSANAAKVCETLSKIASQKIAVLVIVTHSEPVAALAPVRIQMLDGKILNHFNDHAHAG